MTEKNKDLKCSMDLRVKPEDDRGGVNPRVKSEDDRGGESGRSMVEMLGVLAVVGVLSVGSIAGYTYAMNKHYANELLAGASERAVLVTAQIVAGRTPNLNEFAHYSNVGGTFGQAEELEDGSGFTIPVSGVKGAVCENLIQATEGTDISIANDDADLSVVSCDDDNPNDIVFVYKTGLGGSETGTETSECDPACEEGQQCIGGACAEVTGECSKNSDCDTWCAAGEKCYCAISASGTYNDSACYTGFTGKCAVATTRSGVTGGYTVSAKPITWWSAVNFCKAHNASLVSFSELGITGGYQDDGECEGSECGTVDWQDLLSKIAGTGNWYWVTDAVSCDFNTWECTSGTNNNSCFSFGVYPSSAYVYYDFYRYDAIPYALCEKSSRF